jgi:hypothetical protein
MTVCAPRDIGAKIPEQPPKRGRGLLMLSCAEHLRNIFAKNDRRGLELAPRDALLTAERHDVRYAAL